MRKHQPIRVISSNSYSERKLCEITKTFFKNNYYNLIYIWTFLKQSSQSATISDEATFKKVSEVICKKSNILGASFPLVIPKPWNLR